MPNEKQKTPHLDECRFCTIDYTEFDIFGHDDYRCLCALKGGKEVDYTYCARKCSAGKPKDNA